MKKFIIAVCCIVVCVLLFDYLYYYQGVYIDFFPNKKPITFVCTKGEKIYLDEGNGFEEFQRRRYRFGYARRMVNRFWHHKKRLFALA